MFFQHFDAECDQQETDAFVTLLKETEQGIQG
jgi:hypothetical protein